MRLLSGIGLGPLDKTGWRFVQTSLGRWCCGPVAGKPWSVNPHMRRRSVCTQWSSCQCLAVVFQLANCVAGDPTIWPNSSFKLSVVHSRDFLVDTTNNNMVPDFRKILWRIYDHKFVIKLWQTYDHKFIITKLWRTDDEVMIINMLIFERFNDDFMALSYDKVMITSNFRLRLF